MKSDFYYLICNKNREKLNYFFNYIIREILDKFLIIFSPYIPHFASQMPICMHACFLPLLLAIIPVQNLHHYGPCVLWLFDSLQKYYLYIIFSKTLFLFLFFMKTPFPSKSWYSSSYSLRNIISLWIFALHLLPPDIPYSKKQDSPTHKLANLSLSLLGLSPRAQAPCNHYSNCTNPIFPHTPELPLFSWDPMLSTADYGLYSTTTRENSSQHQWLRTIRVTPSCHSTSYLIT